GLRDRRRGGLHARRHLVADPRRAVGPRLHRLGQRGPVRTAGQAVSAKVIADALAGTCLISGALLSLAAGVGLLRFPDLLSRMHSATKPQVLGLLLILTGAALRLQNTIDITTLVLVGLFQLVTAPVSAHMIGRAVYRAGQVRRDLLVVDELADDTRDHGPEHA